MCNNYLPVQSQLLRDVYGVEPPPLAYPPETWPDYAAPIIVAGGEGTRQTLVGTFGMVPKPRIPPGVAKFDTTNARSETVGEKRSFSGPWKKGQLCLVPAASFYEPFYVEHELALIGEMQYEPYFLTVYDIVRFARANRILCQGRGSAANSAVCYCLGITEVDPARGNLLFERFISRERGEPPDIDVDFEHQRREEVIQYLYAKYGRTRAALAAAVATYRPRSALRESGKALGVDPAIVDMVAKAHHWFDGKADLLKRFAESGVDIESELTQRWANMATQLLGFPRHLSQHSGGFVLARGKLSRLVPIENAAMPDRSVIRKTDDRDRAADQLGRLAILPGSRSCAQLSAGVPCRANAGRSSAEITPRGPNDGEAPVTRYCRSCGLRSNKVALRSR